MPCDSQSLVYEYNFQGLINRNCCEPDHSYVELSPKPEPSAGLHCSDVILSTMGFQITGASIVCSGTDQRKHQSSASLAFVRGIQWSPVDYPHKWPVTRKCFHLKTLSCVEPVKIVYSNGNPGDVTNPTTDGSMNMDVSGIILGMGWTNQRRRYIVTSSLIGLAHTRIDHMFTGNLRNIECGYLGTDPTSLYVICNVKSR